MKKFNHIIQYVIIKFLFYIFEIIGFKLSSNSGYLIGKYLGPMFRSKKSIILNLKKANIKNNLDTIASNVLGNYGRIFSDMFIKNFRNNKLKKYISIDGLEHLENIKKNKKKWFLYLVTLIILN